jgi:hypothetical protein
MTKLRAGDWVEVRGKEEILATLDKRGRMEGLPFMPQMFQYCGQRFQVFKRAHKTCDFVYRTWGRRLPDGVHLDLRCDGEAYGGCQNGCLLFWKAAWLKPVNSCGPSAVKRQHTAADSSSSSLKPLPSSSGATEADVWAGTKPEDADRTGELRYSCQMTQVMEFTTPLAWWDIRQYLEDYRSGNVTLAVLLRGLIYSTYYNLSEAGIGVGPTLQWLYEKVLRAPWPRSSGTIPSGQTTPACVLGLQPGEFARIKSHREILATLNTDNKNRGMFFDAEMVPHCGGTYRVRNRVKKFVDERTGKLTTLKTDAIILEGVWCTSRYSHCRMFCPRSLYSWWRESWLQRVTDKEPS